MKTDRTHSTRSSVGIRRVDVTLGRRVAVMCARARLIAVLVVLVVACRVVAASMATPAGEQAQTSPLDPSLRTDFLEGAGQLPRLRSLLISVDGRMVEEHYYRGATADRAANLKSASKSIVSILVGIAIDHGDIPSVDQSIGTYFPDYFSEEQDRAKAAITIQDLLTMQAGLETTSNRNYGRWVQSADWVRHILSRPMLDRPGRRRSYSTGNTHLLSAILTESTGMSTLAFGRRYLAQPLGFTLPAWLQDPQGIYFGGNEMQMTPRAMLSVGELVLADGMLDGRQIVSESWVRESMVPRSISERSGQEYGYGWWLRTMANYRAYYAWGFGGQFIFVVPDLQLVVTMTSSPNLGEGRRQHLRALYEMVEEQIIPAVRRAALAD